MSVILFFIPVWLSVCIILLLISGLDLIIKSVATILFCTLFAIGFLLLLFILISTILYNISIQNVWASLTGLLLIIPLFTTLFLIGEVANMDECGYLFSTFNWSPYKKLLIFFLIIAIIKYILFILALSVEKKWINFGLFIIQILLLLVSYNYIIGTSIKSYTDYASTHIQNSVNNVNEYEVLTDTKIYYGCPQFHYNRLFPYFSPIKYSTKTFKKGDSVIAVDSSITLEDDRYIEVTNGKLTGYVNKKNLLKEKTPNYTWFFEIAHDNADMYKAIIEKRTNILGNDYNNISMGKKLHLKLQRGDKAIILEEVDNHYYIKTGDGTKGLIAFKNIKTNREKIIK